MVADLRRPLPPASLRHLAAQRERSRSVWALLHADGIQSFTHREPADESAARAVFESVPQPVCAATDRTRGKAGYLTIRTAGGSADHAYRGGTRRDNPASRGREVRCGNPG